MLFFFYLLPLDLHLRSVSGLITTKIKPTDAGVFSLSLCLCSTTSPSMSPFSGWQAQSAACSIYAALPFGKSLAANAIALSPCCPCPRLCMITCCWNLKESCFEGPRGASQGPPFSLSFLPHPSAQRGSIHFCQPSRGAPVFMIDGCFAGIYNITKMCFQL